MRFFSFRSKWSLVIWYVATLILCFGIISSFGWRFGGVLGFTGLVYPLYLVVGGISLTKELRLRGYDWIRFRHGFVLVTQYHAKAWRLPARDQAASIPGYEDSVPGLGRIIRQSHDLPEVLQGGAPIPEVREWIAKHGALPEPPPLPLSIRLFATPMTGLTFVFLAINIPITILEYRTGWKTAWLYSFNGLMAPLYMLLLAAFIPGRLRNLGYPVITFPRTYRIAFILHHHIWKAPRHEDLQNVLQTHDIVDIETLCRAIGTANQKR